MLGRQEPVTGVTGAVTPDGAGSRFTWEMTIESDEAAESMRAIAAAGAEALKAYLEGA